MGRASRQRQQELVKLVPLGKLFFQRMDHLCLIFLERLGRFTIAGDISALNDEQLELLRSMNGDMSELRRLCADQARELGQIGGSACL